VTALLCLIKSGIIESATESDIDILVKRLTNVRRREPQLIGATTQVLCELLDLDIVSRPALENY